jgi:ABC-type phosphate transport system substrate-binding protein
VKQIPYSIGYVELASAVKNKLAYGWVKNQAGNFVKANLESVTAAAAEVAHNMPADFRVSITNAPGRKGLSDLEDIDGWQKLTQELLLCPITLGNRN